MPRNIRHRFEPMVGHVPTDADQQSDQQERSAQLPPALIIRASFRLLLDKAAVNRILFVHSAALLLNCNRDVSIERVLLHLLHVARGSHANDDPAAGGHSIREFRDSR